MNKAVPHSLFRNCWHTESKLTVLYAGKLTEVLGISFSLEKGKAFYGLPLSNGILSQLMRHVCRVSTFFSLLFHYWIVMIILCDTGTDQEGWGGEGERAGTLYMYLGDALWKGLTTEWEPTVFENFYNRNTCNTTKEKLLWGTYSEY